MQTKDRNTIKSCTPGIMAVLAIGFLIIIYAPLETLFSNTDEFWFDFKLLFPYLILTWLILAVIGSGILILANRISKTLYEILVIAGFIALIDFYVQGNFLVKNLPQLDGTAIDWSLYSGERIKSAVLIVILIAVAIIITRITGREKAVNTIKYISAGIVCFLLITLIMLGISTRGFRSKSQYTCTNHGINTFSDDSNFIIFVLDATSGRVMKDLIDTEPRYSELLKDFTFYTDTMGAYSFTMHSVPFILSGDWYENDEDFQEYLNKAYTGEESIVRKLYDSGYTVGIYETDMRIDGDKYAFIDNVIKNDRGVNNAFAFVRWNIQMGGFRYFPFDLKRICFVSPMAFLGLQKISQGETIFEHDNRKCYEELTGNEPETVSDKRFKYIRILGSHVPWTYDENLNEISDASYTDQMKSGLEVVDTYLEQMKKVGSYDNSVIIIMADHGYDPDGLDTLKRTNPILFIKGINETHDEIRLNDSRVSFEDLQDAYADLINGRKSDELFTDIDPDRIRRYIYYEYLDEDHMLEYEQSGKATSWDTLIPTGNKYDSK